MADAVRDGAGNIIIPAKQAGSRGMDPQTPLFTRAVDSTGADVVYGGGGGGGSGGTSASPSYTVVTSGPSGTQPLGATTDAATASGDDTTMIGALRAIRDKLLGTLTTTLATGANVIGAVTQSGTWNITNITGTVSLPTGASTSAAQGTGNTSLASIDGKTPLGLAARAASRPVTIATDQGNLEPGGTAITGTAMPAGGTGLTGWLSAIWQRSQVYVEQTNQAAASNAQVAGLNRTIGAQSQWTRFNCVAISNQTGTLFIQASNDGFTSAVNVASVALTANVSGSLTVPVAFLAYRALVQNGATAATVTITSSFTAA